MTTGLVLSTKIRFVAVLMMLLTVPALLCAEQVPMSSRLSAEPASLLDIGVLRLTRHVEAVEDTVAAAWSLDGRLPADGWATYVRFDASADRILVTFHAVSEAGEEEELRDGCKSALLTLRSLVWKELPQLFEHVNQDTSRRTDTDRKATANLLELRCYVSGRDSSDGRLSAKLPFMAEDVQYDKREK